MEAITGGRWYVKEGVDQMICDDTTIANLNGWFVFSDADTHGNKEMDAKLIAAAPELLKALQTFVERQERGWHINLAWNEDTRKLIKSAIEKATI